MSLELIIGTGIVSFVLLYFSFKIENEHFTIKLLSIIFSFILLIVMGKGVIDANTTCSPMVSNQTIVGNITSYSYQNVCFTNAFKTPTIFYKLIIAFFGMFIAYLIFYLGYWALENLRKSYYRGKR